MGFGKSWSSQMYLSFKDPLTNIIKYLGVRLQASGGIYFAMSISLFTCPMP
jgi:hypothetical protein